jgi:hypothetical protein
VAASLLEIVQRNSLADLELIEEALRACEHYRHALVKAAWQKLHKFREHLLSLQVRNGCHRGAVLALP